MNNNFIQISTSNDDSSSCSVHAISKCLDIPFDLAQAKLESLGRVKYCGAYHFPDIANALGLKPRPEHARQRLNKVLPKLSKGRYVVRIKGHVFCVIDGVIYDTFKQHNPEVLMVYEYKK